MKKQLVPYVDYLPHNKMPGIEPEASFFLNPGEKYHNRSSEYLKNYDRELGIVRDASKEKYRPRGSKTTRGPGATIASERVYDELNRLSEILNGKFKYNGKLVHTWKDREAHVERRVDYLIHTINDAVQEPTLPSMRGRLSADDAKAFLQIAKTKLDIRFKTDQYAVEKGYVKQHLLGHSYRVLNEMIAKYEAAAQNGTRMLEEVAQTYSSTRAQAKHLASVTGKAKAAGKQQIQTAVTRAKAAAEKKYHSKLKRAQDALAKSRADRDTFRVENESLAKANSELTDRLESAPKPEYVTKLEQELAAAPKAQAVAKLTSELAEQKKYGSKLESDLADKNKQLATAVSTVHTVNEENGALKLKARNLEHRLDLAQTELNQARDAVRSVLLLQLQNRANYTPAPSVVAPVIPAPMAAPSAPSAPAPAVIPIPAGYRVGERLPKETVPPTTINRWGMPAIIGILAGLTAAAIGGCGRESKSYTPVTHPAPIVRTVEGPGPVIHFEIPKPQPSIPGLDIESFETETPAWNIPELSLRNKIGPGYHDTTPGAPGTEVPSQRPPFAPGSQTSQSSTAQSPPPLDNMPPVPQNLMPPPTAQPAPLPQNPGTTSGVSSATNPIGVLPLSEQARKEFTILESRLDGARFGSDNKHIGFGRFDYVGKKFGADNQTAYEIGDDFTDRQNLDQMISIAHKLNAVHMNLPHYHTSQYDTLRRELLMNSLATKEEIDTIVDASEQVSRRYKILGIPMPWKHHGKIQKVTQ